MSESTFPPGGTDRNLLFGVIAVHLDFIERADLLTALQAWNADRSRPLGEVLVESDLLPPRRRNLLEDVVREYLVQHDMDPVRGLAAACTARALSFDLNEFAPAIHGGQSTLEDHHTLARPDSADPPLPSVGVRTSAGKRFRIIRPHARGALGEVFLARDDELNREVALKEIQTPYANNSDSRARFLLEAEITGSLEHPGVVPVYGLGAHPDGRPYYAMRFIRGESLHDAINRFHQADGPDRDPGERALALRGLLRRFVDVCNAVAYAHSRGVVHRDIKPSNVMLGPYGETLVVDWGLAKAFDKPMTEDSIEVPVHPVSGQSATATMLGQAVGTPSFMPPEQAAGRVDHVGPWSDVYSLGATLYNLLTGMPPFCGETVQEILQQVQGNELLAPRRITRRVPAALEAVVLKAMSYSPPDRYRSVHDLAQEVERWLADEPVQAYPEPAFQRMQRWTRRHRPLVSGLGVLLVTVLVFLTWGLWAVGREQQRTKKERDIAQHNLALAETNLKLARDAVGKCFLLAKENPLLAEQPKIRRMLLESALHFYKGFRESKPDDASISEEQGVHVSRLAFIVAEIGDKETALKRYREAHELFTALAEADPANEGHQSELARIDNDVGNLLSELEDRDDEARKSYESARERWEVLLARNNALEYQRELAATLNNLGELFLKGGKLAEAMEHFDRAVILLKNLVKAPQTRPEANRLYQADLAAVYNNLGTLRERQGQVEEARRAYEGARTIRAGLVEAGRGLPSDRIELAKALTNLGMLSRNPTKALPLIKMARNLCLELAQPRSDVPEYHSELARTYNVLARMLQNSRATLQNNRHRSASSYPRRRPGSGSSGAEAKQLYRQALAIQELLVKADARNVQFRIDLANTCVNLGNLARGGRDTDAALAWYDQALKGLRGKLETYRERGGRNEKTQAVLYRVHNCKARALDELKNYREAAVEWDRAAARCAEAGDRLSALVNKAFSLVRGGDYKAALQEVDRLQLLKLLNRQEKPPEDFDVALFNAACITSLAIAEVKKDAGLPEREREKRAEALARDAVALLRRLKKDTDFFKKGDKRKHFLGEKDLRPLDPYPEYLQFLADLEEKPGRR
jgi:serine/threonine-protein kinase